MNRLQQAQFIRESLRSTERTLLARLASVPETWDGHELRAWIADDIATEIGSISLIVRDPRSARARDYRMTVASFMFEPAAPEPQGAAKLEAGEYRVDVRLAREWSADWDVIGDPTGGGALQTMAEKGEVDGAALAEQVTKELQDAYDAAGPAGRFQVMAVYDFRGTLIWQLPAEK